mmetsp:Transcript_24663/g.73991  ORF Transcript_24663/g.73991 Transcript_24663/m.73991 type:complete len:279 (+) Transcript_24663:6264-7100(+)
MPATDSRRCTPKYSTILDNSLNIMCLAVRSQLRRMCNRAGTICPRYGINLTPVFTTRMPIDRITRSWIPTNDASYAMVTSSRTTSSKKYSSVPTGWGFGAERACCAAVKVFSRSANLACLPPRRRSFSSWGSSAPRIPKRRSVSILSSRLLDSFSTAVKVGMRAGYSVYSLVTAPVCCASCPRTRMASSFRVTEDWSWRTPRMSPASVGICAATQTSSTLHSSPIATRASGKTSELMSLSFSRIASITAWTYGRTTRGACLMSSIRTSIDEISFRVPE